MRNTAFAKLAFLSLSLSMFGCPDPQGSFDEFGERYNAIHNSGDGGAGGAPDCVPPQAGEHDGKWLFSLSAVLSPKKAFALDATVTTTSDGADGLLVDMTLQPLSKADQKTPVGDPIVLTDLPVAADGSFTWDLGTVTLGGTANPISDLDIISTLILTGNMCGDAGLDFICGGVAGILTAPVPDYDLAGSSFTMQRYDGTLPTPLINCAKDPAKY